MVFTREQAIKAFDHVMDNVLLRGNSSPLKQALIGEHVTDIFDLVSTCSFNTEIITNLTYTTQEQEQAPVPAGDKNLVRLFLAFVDHR